MTRVPTFEEIGSRIRAAREAKGLSQQDLATMLGVSRPVVTKIESGGKATNSVEIAKIADYLGVPLEALMASIETESLAARFRRSSADATFVASASKVETLIKGMLDQVNMKRR